MVVDAVHSLWVLPAVSLLCQMLGNAHSQYIDTELRISCTCRFECLYRFFLRCYTEISSVGVWDFSCEPSTCWLSDLACWRSSIDPSLSSRLLLCCQPESMSPKAIAFWHLYYQTDPLFVWLREILLWHWGRGVTGLPALCRLRNMAQDIPTMWVTSLDQMNINMDWWVHSL